MEIMSAIMMDSTLKEDLGISVATLSFMEAIELCLLSGAEAVGLIITFWTVAPYYAIEGWDTEARIRCNQCGFTFYWRIIGDPPSVMEAPCGCAGNGILNWTILRRIY